MISNSAECTQQYYFRSGTFYGLKVGTYAYGAVWMEKGKA